MADFTDNELGSIARLLESKIAKTERAHRNRQRQRLETPRGEMSMLSDCQTGWEYDPALDRSYQSHVKLLAKVKSYMRPDGVDNI